MDSCLNYWSFLLTYEMSATSDSVTIYFNFWISTCITYKSSFFKPKSYHFYFVCSWIFSVFILYSKNSYVLFKTTLYAFFLCFLSIFLLFSNSYLSLFSNNSFSLRVIEILLMLNLSLVNVPNVFYRYDRVLFWGWLL